MLGMQAALVLPGILTKAGTKAQISNSYIRNGIYDVSFEAGLNADHTAVKGFVGKGMLQAYGLEAIIQAFKAYAASPGISQPGNTDIDSYVSALSILQMSGQQATDKQGRAIRKYDIEVTKQGAILMNGTNIEDIIGGKKDATTPQAGKGAAGK
jgi:hypothetical protein